MIIGAFRTVVLAEAELFPELKSTAEELTVAELVSVPVAVGVITIVTVALPDGSIVPSAHDTTFPEGVQLPWLGVIETTVAPLAGKVSVRVTPAAAAGPLFETVTV